MFESEEQCIVNALNIKKGSHILYRGLGLDFVDYHRVSVKSEIVQLLSKYYPDVSVAQIRRKSNNDASFGGSNYEISIKAEEK